jgi:hypothetical protein
MRTLKGIIIAAICFTVAPIAGGVQGGLQGECSGDDGCGGLCYCKARPFELQCGTDYECFCPAETD